MVNQASYVALAVIVSFGTLGVGPLHETVKGAAAGGGRRNRYQAQVR